MENIIENYENEENLKKAIIFWMNWIFKEDEDFHFTENNFLGSLKNGRVLYELSLRLEKEVSHNKTLFLPQKKKPMTKVYYNRSLNKLFFLNSFEKLMKNNYLPEKELNDHLFDYFEKNDKSEIENINLPNVLKFYWNLMKEYKNRNFQNSSNRDYVTIGKTNEYDLFLSELKAHIFEDSVGITSVMDSKEGVFLVDHFDINATQNTFMIIGKSKILDGKEQPTIFTRFGEGLDQKEVDYAVKTTLEAKNNLLETTMIIFTEAYKETKDFSEQYLRDKEFGREDFRVSKSIDFNNLTLQDVELKEIVDNKGNLSIQEDQMIVFHNNVEVVFTSHQRNPLHIPLLIAKWRELYPGFERNYTFCSDNTLPKRLGNFIKEKMFGEDFKEDNEKTQYVGPFPLSPGLDNLNSKLELEVLKQEVLQDNVMEEQRQHNLCKMFENSILKEEVLDSEKRKILGEIEEPKQILSDVPLQTNFKEDFNYKENFYQQQIKILKEQLQNNEDNFLLRENRLLGSNHKLEEEYLKMKQKYNSLVTSLLFVFNVAVMGYYFYLISNPLI